MATSVTVRTRSVRFISCVFEVIQNTFHTLHGEIYHLRVDRLVKEPRLHESKGKGAAGHHPFIWLGNFTHLL